MRSRCVISEPVDGLVLSDKLGWYRVDYTPLHKQGRFFISKNAALLSIKQVIKEDKENV